MDFNVGDTVVYPHHGAATIESIEERVIKGEPTTYLVLKVAQGDLTVRVPAKNAELVGVRDVVGREGLDRVFEVLKADNVEEPTNWSRRYKSNLEKLASGDVHKVAEVVRDLWRREEDRGLSAGEKRMLVKARQVLVGELALAEGFDDESRDEDITRVLERIDNPPVGEDGEIPDAPLTPRVNRTSQSADDAAAKGAEATDGAEDAEGTADESADDDSESASESASNSATVQKAAVKKTAAKKSTATQPAAKKTAATKSTAKKSTAKKTAAKKTAAKKTAATKSTAKKTAAKKTAAKKSTATQSAAKKTAAKRSTAKKTADADES